MTIFWGNMVSALIILVVLFIAAVLGYYLVTLIF